MAIVSKARTGWTGDKDVWIVRRDGLNVLFAIGSLPTDTFWPRTALRARVPIGIFPGWKKGLLGRTPRRRQGG